MASHAFMLMVPLKPSVKSAWPAGWCSRAYTPRTSETAAPASAAHRNAIVPWLEVPGAAASIG